MFFTSRSGLLALSVLDCAFGLFYLFGPHGARSAMLGLNIVLAVILAILTGRDLMARGLRLGWLAGLSYIFAPLVGLVLYGIFSARPRELGSAS
ncbi:MAG: hypothetical protein WCD35_02560 [Mycobacteriales bacterium]